MINKKNKKIQLMVNQLLKIHKIPSILVCSFYGTMAIMFWAMPLISSVRFFKITYWWRRKESKIWRGRRLKIEKKIKTIMWPRWHSKTTVIALWYSTKEVSTNNYLSLTIFLNVCINVSHIFLLLIIKIIYLFDQVFTLKVNIGIQKNCLALT